jgi:hypothetical protein
VIAALQLRSFTAPARWPDSGHSLSHETRTLQYADVVQSETTDVCKMIATLAIASFAMLPVPGLSNSASGRPSMIETSACLILKAPTRFDRKEVDFAGRAESDGLHGIVVYGDGCAPNGIVLVFATKHDDGPGIAEFRKAILSLPFGTLYNKVTATFRGVIQYRA